VVKIDSAVIDGGGGGKRVLVVDDHVGVADALTQRLTLDGFSARAAYDGLAALEAAAVFRPEIVVLDLALPMINGWEVARRLQAMPVFRRPRMIAVSGFVDPVHRAHSLSVGFEEHLAKPYSLASLRRALGQQAACAS
jgi:CheY-like chemotaxis protein